VVLNGFELLGEGFHSKEVAMNTANFVISSKGFFLRYLRVLAAICRALSVPQG
jgi:hypothetical protein